LRGAPRREFSSGAAGDFFGAKTRRFVAFPKLWNARGGCRGVFRIMTLWVGWFVSAVFAHGADLSLASARQAQAKLGPEIWSQVIRIENQARLSRYPSSLHALVFEVAGILWIYTEGEGTQSFSLHLGRLAEEKADFGPLLRDLDPGFARWSVVPEDAPAPVARRGALRNGCFIESLAALRTRRERGELVPHARLLSYYFLPGSGHRGHTVLAYDTDQGVEIVDPLAATTERRFSLALAGDALNLAQALAGPLVAKARWVAVDTAVPRRAQVAGAGGLAGGNPDDATAW
jgi:hypothetical protein